MRAALASAPPERARARARHGPPPDRPAAPAPGVAAADPAARGRRRLCCRACGAVIARPEDAIAVGGAHSHHVFNPAGIVFHIGCFRDAPGVRAVGPRTGRFTWFRGYDWVVTACGTCARHLGWMYHAIADTAPATFQALVLDRLVETGGDDGGDDGDDAGG
ncbi:cereblon family protein [Roseospira goensis]|uniref:CULT domain-containing protein n=1 Tax=Roseospira goensis TaxID=391922 RepID=A0A7W6WKH2_9PROT|nr:cereblon family protein [Roseospira goensis]MBB4285749.1 hypothetical protein [Roseospira goensis]